jgi:hypothetical protein
MWLVSKKIAVPGIIIFEEGIIIDLKKIIELQNGLCLRM